MENKPSFLSRIIEAFLRGNLAILLIIISLLAGAAALYLTPREEEPQIVVPLADVMVMYPGGSAEEVEKMVSSRLERLLYQIDGVEYVYSISRPEMAVVTVRFHVGQDRENSLVKLYNKVYQNLDKVTPGVTGWIIKPVEIDDVPIVNVTLYGEGVDDHQLYRVAEEVVGKLQHIPNSARISIHGGRKRVAYVYLDPERLSAYGLSAMEVAGAIQISNAQMGSGQFEQGNHVVRVEAGPYIKDTTEVENLLVTLYQGRPVYLRDVASVQDGPEEVKSYSRLGFGPAGKKEGAAIEGKETYPAVTIAVAKKKGSNAVWVAQEVEKRMQELAASTLPDNVSYRITRNYGETANDKVNGLVKSLAEAIITVIALITFYMGWRTGTIVAIAVPITYSLVLLCNYLFGYTINRVTLFALILALGLVVDDPIVSVENIYRHLTMGGKRKLEAISIAINEVMPPVILATLAIIVSFLPMFFITGMMGPYMRPMALNVPLAMLMSMVVSFAITPWVSSKLLKSDTGHGEEPYDVTQTTNYKLYRRVIMPFVNSRLKSVLLLFTIAVMFVLSVGLALTGHVPLKMLPFDNKNEIQVMIDPPEGTTLETTDAIVRRVENILITMPEVTDYVSTVGTASPMDFNGLVRHYYMREGANVADIRVNLLPRDDRKMSSHAIVLRIRDSIDAVARETGASIKLVEAPPGPPVLSTVVAEVYGTARNSYDDLIRAAGVVKKAMAGVEGVVDIDDTVEADQRKLFFRIDREKAGLNGVSTDDIVKTLRISLAGMPAGVIHKDTEQNELPIILRLPRKSRSDVGLLENIVVKGRTGHDVQLGELGSFEENVQEKTIYHKNQERVVYVTSEMAGRGPAYAVLDLQKHFKDNQLPNGVRIDWRGEGEWKITLDVFRDLGLAFSAALVGIYVLLVYETASYLIPIVIMLSIPLTMIGIMPGFALLNVVVNKPVGGYPDPVFFTATAMIGMIALSGIVVRNAIILIDFIQTQVKRGQNLVEAIVESGAVRFRPIFLTAGTTTLGAWPITLDPIFSGLAWSIIFGMVVSTAFTLVVIPTVYYLLYGGKQ
ncbi:MAG: efflux RND transporter permease subunit [Deltaproteobacteria bacterium]|nr:efflux RND transporter permease subunit [Deltaproteobacteria bacterium]